MPPANHGISQRLSFGRNIVRNICETFGGNGVCMRGGGAFWVRLTEREDRKKLLRIAAEEKK
jgi:hypothetical protein